MKHKLLKKICLFLLAAVTLCASFTARAASVTQLSDLLTLPAPPSVESDYAILMEAKSGAILYEKNATAKAYPASITKIMTALLTVENCSFEEEVTFSYRATHEIAPDSSTIARTEGEVMTVEECLYGLMVASANEVAQGLAEHVSASLESFVNLMNFRAQELGTVNTHFANAHGYHDDEHYTCAFDMALIMREAIRHESLLTIMGTESYQIPPTNKHDEITYLRSQHPLLTNASGMRYPYAVAGKTGLTDEAMYTLVTYAKQGDLDLICVVMHSDSRAQSGTDSTNLFNYGFQNFSCYNLSQQESVLDKSGATFLSKNLINFTSSGDVYCVLPNGMTPDILESKVVLFDDSSKPDVLATRIYSLNGKEFGRCDLTVLPPSEGLALKPIVSVVPSQNEILREKHLGLPLIYWILIGGGLGILLVIWLSIRLIIRSVKRYERKKARAKQAMNQMTDGRFPPLL